MENPARIFDRQVILELKFTNRIPTGSANWRASFQVIQWRRIEIRGSHRQIGARRLTPRRGGPKKRVIFPIPAVRAGGAHLDSAAETAGGVPESFPNPRSHGRKQRSQTP